MLKESKEKLTLGAHSAGVGCWCGMMLVWHATDWIRAMIHVVLQCTEDRDDSFGVAMPWVHMWCCKALGPLTIMTIDDPGRSERA